MPYNRHYVETGVMDALKDLGMSYTTLYASQCRITAPLNTKGYVILLNVLRSYTERILIILLSSGFFIAYNMGVK